jgi:hypothetical protein
MKAGSFARAALLAAAALPLTTLPAYAVGGMGIQSPSYGLSQYAKKPSGGFDFHNDAPKPAPQTDSHSSTGPAGTSRTTTAATGSNGAVRTTTATNGNYSKTTSSGATSNGDYGRTSTASNGYSTKTSSTTGNTNTGDYNHSGSGSSPYGSYSTSNGVVYHGAVVTNPAYVGAPAWGWNAGVAWYPAYGYYGGGFWGPYAAGVATAAVFGTLVYNSQTITSYQVEANSPGAKLLAGYHLTQVPCGPPNLVVIFGPNGGVICATPNGMVSAGNYSVNANTLTIVSEKS